jgi:hypothetical protein
MAIRQLERNCQEYIELGELNECLSLVLSTVLASGVWYDAHASVNVQIAECMHSVWKQITTHNEGKVRQEMNTVIQNRLTHHLLLPILYLQLTYFTR